MAHSVKSPRIKKAETFPVSVFVSDKKTELTIKLDAQFVAVVIEVAVPIRWSGNISVHTLQTVPDIPN